MTTKLKGSRQRIIAAVMKFQDLRVQILPPFTRYDLYRSQWRTKDDGFSEFN